MANQKDLIACMEGVVGESLTIEEIEEASAHFINSLPYDQRAAAKANIALLRSADVVNASNYTQKRLAETAIEKKWQAVINEQKGKKRDFYLKAHEENAAMGLFEGNKRLKAIENLQAGTNEAFEYSGVHVEGTKNAKMAEYFRTAFWNKIEDKGLDKHLKGGVGGLGGTDRATEYHIAYALSELNGGEKAPSGTPKWAFEIAQAKIDARKLVIADYEANGIIIRDRKGYITSVTHNPLRMIAPMSNKRALGSKKRGEIAKQDWINFVRDKIDYHRMEVDPADAESMLSEIYDNLIRQVEIPNATANLADQVTKSRTIIWNSPAAEVDYMNQYGHGDFLTDMAFAMERDATTIAAIEWFGTNPKKTLDKLIADADPTVANKRQANRVRRIYDEYTGLNSSAESHILATVGTAHRAVTTAAFLDASIYSYGMDVPIRAAVMRDFGGSKFKNSIDTYIDTVFRPLSTDTQKQVARAFGYIEDGLRGAVGRGILATDGIAGKAAGLNQLTFKLNLSDPWVNKQKRGFITAVSGLYGDQANVSMDAMIPEMKAHLRRFGITADEWDVLRTEGLIEIEGAKFVVPELVDRKIGQKYREMMFERTNTAVLTASLRSRAFSSGGLKRGTWAGEGVRSGTQFWTFIYTFQERIILPMLRGTTVGQQVGGESRWRMMGGLGSALLVSSYVTMSLKNILQGKEPPDLSDEDQVSQLISRSGILGLQGELFYQAIFSPYSREKGVDLAQLFPASADWLMTASKGIDYKEDEGFKLHVRNVEKVMPYSDLPYMPVLNYMFVNSLKEAIDPEYAQKRIKTGKKFNNPYIESPLNIAAPDRQLLEDLE